MGELLPLRLLRSNHAKIVHFLDRDESLPRIPECRGHQAFPLESAWALRHKGPVLTSERSIHIAGDLPPLILRIRRAFGVRSFSPMEEYHA